jgi:hypothetical protein
MTVCAATFDYYNSDTPRHRRVKICYMLAVRTQLYPAAPIHAKRSEHSTIIEHRSRVIHILDIDTDPDPAARAHARSNPYTGMTAVANREYNTRYRTRYQLYATHGTSKGIVDVQGE